MKKHILLLAFTSITLTGCGGGSDSANKTEPAEVSTGIFIDSPVKGLYYETKTQSGLTNAAGEFNYVEGETITFKLGGSVLGFSSAQEVITPFTLTGTKALDQQTQITNAFLGQTPNSFEKAINIATLLQSLDLDGNHENGIDLGNAHTELSNISIPLLIKSSGFTANTQYLQARTIMQTQHPMSFVDAAKNMYESLGITIESNLIAKQTNNSNNGFFESIEFEYDQQGRISEISFDRNNDGQADASQVFTYDQAGRLHTIFNSANSTTQTLSYDTNNKLISRVTEDGSNINLNEAFDYQGTQLSKFSLDKTANGSADFVSQYSYNENDQLSGYVIDQDGDEQADINVTILRTNNKVTRFTESSPNNTSLEIAYVYDANGNIISQNTQESENGILTTTNARFFYDASNNLSRYELDKNFNGKADYIESYKYNQNKQRTLYLRDNNADGKWDFMAQYFYDINGNRTKMIEDSNGDGLVDKRWEANLQTVTTETTWNDIANKL